MAKPKVSLLFEEEDGTQTWESIKINTSSIRQLKRWMKQKRNLLDCKGDNPLIVEYIKGEIQRYQEDQKKYRVDMKANIQVVSTVTGQTVGEVKKKVKGALNPFKRR